MLTITLFQFLLILSTTGIKTQRIQKNNLHSNLTKSFKSNVKVNVDYCDITINPYCYVSLQAVYVSGQYGVILPANFLKEKEGIKLKVYNNVTCGVYNAKIVVRVLMLLFTSRNAKIVVRVLTH
jgi:hypothetical protein